MTQQVLHRTGFRWPEIFLYAAIGVGPLALVLSSPAQGVSARFAIETSQVTRAMGEASLPTEGVEVKLPAPFTASAANAAIEVASVSPVGPHAVRMRLLCRDHSQCVPFFAVATFPDAVDATKLHGVAGGPSALVAGRSDEKVKSVDTNDTASVRAGAPATLKIDEDRIHIRLEVICLQSGPAGSRVRVSSLDHKQIYTAEVVTPTLLKGELLQ